MSVVGWGKKGYGSQEKVAHAAREGTQYIYVYALSFHDPFVVGSTPLSSVTLVGKTGNLCCVLTGLLGYDALYSYEGFPSCIEYESLSWVRMRVRWTDGHTYLILSYHTYASIT